MDLEKLFVAGGGRRVAGGGGRVLVVQTDAFDVTTWRTRTAARLPWALAPASGGTESRLRDVIMMRAAGAVI